MAPGWSCAARTPSCNPYLAFAVCLAAGLDGIQRPADAAGGDQREPLRHRRADLEAHGVRRLPGSLEAAIHALEADRVVTAALGSHVTDQYVTGKLREWEEYRTQVSQWELDDSTWSPTETAIHLASGKRGGSAYGQDRGGLFQRGGPAPHRCGCWNPAAALPPPAASAERETIRAVRKLGGAVVVCGFKLRDMTASELAASLRDTAVAAGARLRRPPGLLRGGKPVQAAHARRPVGLLRLAGHAAAGPEARQPPPVPAPAAMRRSGG